jgi:hypothetical protein
MQVGHVGSTHPLIHVRRGLMRRLDQPQELTQNANDDSKTHTHSFFFGGTYSFYF